jgi:hypothetical protein
VITTFAVARTTDTAIKARVAPPKDDVVFFGKVITAGGTFTHYTGQRSFAEGLHICRESNIGRSAKNPLPRASARQSLALGKSWFAESSTLSTNRTSAKPQLHKRPTYAIIFAESWLLGSRQNIKFFLDFCSYFFYGALLQY